MLASRLGCFFVVVIVVVFFLLSQWHKLFNQINCFLLKMLAILMMSKLVFEK